MNTFFNYVMLGIVLLLGVEIVDFATGQKSGSMNAFIDAMNNNNLTELAEIASLDGVEVFILIICCIFAFKLIEKTNNLADKFSKGAGTDIGQKMGGLASSAVVAGIASGGGVALKLGEAAWESTGISGKITSTGQAASNFILGKAADFGKAVGLGDYQPGGEKDPNKQAAPERMATRAYKQQSEKAEQPVASVKTEPEQNREKQESSSSESKAVPEKRESGEINT